MKTSLRLRGPLAALSVLVVLTPSSVVNACSARKLRPLEQHASGYSRCRACRIHSFRLGGNLVGSWNHLLLSVEALYQRRRFLHACGRRDRYLLYG
jgi:hypothetical protein